MRFDDYLLRAIEQFTQSIARIVRKLRGQQDQEAEAEIASAYDALLAHDRMFLDMVDAGTLANLLGSADKVRVLAQLSLLEAEVLQRRAQPERALVLQKRALDLLAIARREDPQPGDETLLSALRENLQAPP